VREENLVKAKVHAKLAGARNINFKLADLETESELFLADFSFIFCVGLLYHLRNPSSFLSRCAKSAPKIWISTVISSERDAELVKENDKYRGRIYVEPTDHPLSAIREHSFFPNLGSLCNMLWDAGYNKIELLEQTMTPNGNGPAILLYACY
jgi:2-polyprenyl-3-methyl-5-hydroxy-6-metoxy-1,4-benzoquinol methylase